MQVSNFIIFGVAEAYILLVAVCVFLLLHTRKLKRMVQRLQERTAQLVQDLRETKAARALAQSALDNAASSYKKQINDQLLLTREHHQSLDPDQDIALDLNTEAPLPRRAAAFRHAVLIAEKEALHASDNDAPRWDILERKFSQLMRFYESGDNELDRDDSSASETMAAPGPENAELQAELETLRQALENSNKRVGNLEKFKKLFFDMEKQWKQAKEQTRQYHEQLSAMASQVDNKESYESLLDQYYHAYDTVGKTLKSGTGSQGDIIVIEPTLAKAQVSTIEITREDTRSARELKHLRKVAEDQHKIIHVLQQKLAKARTEEEKDEVIGELQEQLERQTRFVKESETCIQLLEDELSRAMGRVNELESQLDGVCEDIEQIPKMRTVIQQFTEESKDMLQGLANLERENEELLSQVNSQEESDPRIINQMKQELTTLREQHAELEERYLELRLGE